MQRDTQTIQRELLSCLKDFHRFCVTNDICYSLCAGTMLGAVREGGFIAWDDDADVMMTRDNYERFCSAFAASGEMRGYSLIPNVGEPARLCPVGCIPGSLVWIDIFVYDYISQNPVAKSVRLFLLSLMTCIAKTRDGKRYVKLKNYGRLKRLFWHVLYGIGRVIPYSHKASMYKHIAWHWLQGDRSQVHRSDAQYSYRSITEPVAYVTGYKLVPFEDTELMTFEHAHELLVHRYGEDYMTPKRELHGGKEHLCIRENLEKAQGASL